MPSVISETACHLVGQEKCHCCIVSRKKCHCWFSINSCDTNLEIYSRYSTWKELLSIVINLFSQWDSSLIIPTLENDSKKMQLTLDNLNLQQLEPRANTNQSQFPLDFPCTFTVILALVTQTLDNSNLPLTRSNFCFPSGHFYIILPLIT